MDKQLILAVAGSGKTYHIVKQLDFKKRYLLITYTISGIKSIKSEVINQFGYLPENIKIKNYFSFLYSFCYKPFFADEFNDKGITWNYPKSFYDNSFFTNNNYIYHNRISKLLLDKENILDVRARLEKYYDYVLFDEIQDFGGNDFNFLLELAQSKVKFLLVGDFFQHTFDTSRDKKTNQSLHSSLDKYIKRFKKAGFNFDNSTLIKSRRCSKTTCDFIQDRIGIKIESNSDRITECKLIDNKEDAQKIFDNQSLVKLFLTRHYNYKCQSDNWGACKGLGYNDVCVIVNDELYKKIKSGNLISFKSNITRNKFYVACSRTRNNLYFAHIKWIKNHK
ncbi:DNA helicase UvrD [Ulvibacterium marinum]|uniref:DNA helicase UvrD n=1 Tax=Ulvibacterium marinum TaxID=2419782 RepID=UPI002493F54F|nr:DNA helicase UvrD [Ulvibacterium marinum]